MTGTLVAQCPQHPYFTSALNNVAFKHVLSTFKPTLPGGEQETVDEFIYKIKQNIFSILEDTGYTELNWLLDALKNRGIVVSSRFQVAKQKQDTTEAPTRKLRLPETHRFDKDVAFVMWVLGFVALGCECGRHRDVIHRSIHHGILDVYQNPDDDPLYDPVRCDSAIVDKALTQEDNTIIRIPMDMVKTLFPTMSVDDCVIEDNQKVLVRVINNPVTVEKFSYFLPMLTAEECKPTIVITQREVQQTTGEAVTIISTHDDTVSVWHNHNKLPLDLEDLRAAHSVLYDAVINPEEILTSEIFGLGEMRLTSTVF